MIVVESGGTKSTWVFDLNKQNQHRIEIVGLHPQELSSEKKNAILQLVDKNNLKGQSLYFYGAGCESDVAKAKITHFLKSFGLVVKEVQTDIYAACLAMLKHKQGIVGILGTGAVAAQFDGDKVTKQTSGLGYILGDEGSGFDIGKRLLQAYFRTELPEKINHSIEEYFDYQPIVHRIREPDGRMFIAGLTKLAHQYRKEKEIKYILNSAFSDFYTSALQPLNLEGMNNKVHFVGSIAYYFKNELRRTLEDRDLFLGEVRKEAIDEIFNFLSRQNED